MNLPTYRLIYSIIIALCCLILAGSIANAQASTWKTKPVALNCHNVTMQQALEQLAIQANVTILVDGIPIPKPLTLNVHNTAENALTQIADAFDYSWSVSKSGFILMQKRFTDENDQPEIVPDEMRATCQDMLSILRGLYTPPQEGLTTTALFRRLAADLSPKEISLLSSRQGLPVSDLSSQLQSQAVQIIYTKELNPLYLRVDYLDKVFAALSEARIKVEEIPFGGGEIHKYVVLAFQPKTNLSPVLLWPFEHKNILESKPKETAVNNSAPQNSGLYVAYTVDEALQGLRELFQVKATLLPKIREDRRIIFLMQKTDALQAPAAFAEMYNWRLQKNDTQTCFLYRRPIQASRDLREAGKSVLQAFPADIVRCLFTKPATLDGKLYQDPNDLRIILPGASDPSPFTFQKMLLHKRASIDRLQSSLSNSALVKSQTYIALAPGQRRDVSYYLFSAAAGQMISALWMLTNKPHNWMLDPLHSSLFQQNDSYGVIGAGGGYFSVRDGHIGP